MLSLNSISRALGLVAIAALAAAPAARADVTDIVFVIDVSGDMGDEINFIQAALPAINTRFGELGDDVRYALIEFGSSSALTQNMADFDTFAATGSAWDMLAEDPGETEELGSLALATSYPGVDFRFGSKRHVVLVTTEPDGSSSDDKLSARDIFHELGPAFWLFHGTTSASTIRQSYSHLSANGHSFDSQGAPLYFQYESFSLLGDLINEQNFFTPAVPEPGSAVLLACVGGGLLLRRRR